jgi:hypothetical protein
MTEIGTRLERIDAASDLPASVTVVGVRDGLFVVQAVETFSSPFELTPNELRVIYGGDGESAPEVDEPQAWRDFGSQGLAEAAHNARRRYVAEHNAPTPEEQFAADAAE